jgi:hypothetical protein
VKLAIKSTQQTILKVTQLFLVMIKSAIAGQVIRKVMNSPMISNSDMLFFSSSVFGFVSRILSPAKAHAPELLGG